MRPPVPLLVALSLLVALTAATPVSAQPQPPGGPLPGLTPEELAAFQDGLAAFTTRVAPPDGLGPVFNDDSCVACHGGPAPGGASPRLVTRFGRSRGKKFDPLEELGGSLVQDRALLQCAFGPEVVPEEANVETSRRTQPLFGLGLVDAVPDETFEELAAMQRAESRKTAGRVHLVTEIATGIERVGRFGWKAQVPTLEQFSGDALLNEMGMTNPLFTEESCPQGDCAALATCNPRPGLNDDGELVERLTWFQLLLAPPPPGPFGPAAARGELVFEDLGCASCHVSTLETGPHAVAALDRVEFHPYSDFLLHDMGRLGDGIEQGEAGTKEMRTAPLWGVGRQPRLLHDGRALSLEEAIQAHDGQAAAQRRAYGRLSDQEKNDLLAFLRSL